VPGVLCFAGSNGAVGKTTAACSMAVNGFGERIERIGRRRVRLVFQTAPLDGRWNGAVWKATAACSMAVNGFGERIERIEGFAKGRRW